MADDLTSTESRVIPLDRASAVTVRLRRDDSPFAQLGEQERMRLIIRILCELVAYDDEPVAHAEAS